jgi:hypothetical protein
MAIPPATRDVREFVSALGGDRLLAWCRHRRRPLYLYGPEGTGKSIFERGALASGRVQANEIATGNEALHLGGETSRTSIKVTDPKRAARLVSRMGSTDIAEWFRAGCP